MFKAYTLIINRWGINVCPEDAFMHPSRLHENKWQYLLKSAEDEEIFRRFVPRFKWAIEVARKRGYGETKS